MKAKLIIGVIAVALFASACEEAGSGKSSNVNVTSLEISAGRLSRDFASGTTGYSFFVPNQDSVDVTVTLEDSAATFTVEGVAGTSGSPSTVSIGTAPAEKDLEIVVTAEDGTTETYQFDIRSAAAADTDGYEWATYELPDDEEPYVFLRDAESEANAGASGTDAAITNAPDGDADGENGSFLLNVIVFNHATTGGPTDLNAMRANFSIKVAGDLTAWPTSEFGIVNLQDSNYDQAYGLFLDADGTDVELTPVFNAANDYNGTGTTGALTADTWYDVELLITRDGTTDNIEEFVATVSGGAIDETFTITYDEITADTGSSDPLGFESVRHFASYMPEDVPAQGVYYDDLSVSYGF